MDDSPVIRLTLEKILVQLGVDKDTIHAAATGEEAIERFHEVEPSIVFLDMEMPGLDGEQAASAMLQADPETKIVIVSALDRDDDRVRRLVSLGAFELLQKPIHSSDIQRVLHLAAGEDRGLRRIL